jgi:hypothetical protein
VQGLRSPESRSLLEVNEDFLGKRNAAIHFLVIFIKCPLPASLPQ